MLINLFVAMQSVIDVSEIQISVITTVQTNIEIKQEI